MWVEDAFLRGLSHNLETRIEQDRITVEDALLLHVEEERVRITPLDRLLEPYHTLLTQQGVTPRLTLLRIGEEEYPSLSLPLTWETGFALGEILRHAVRMPVYTRFARAFTRLMRRDTRTYRIERKGSLQSYRLEYEDPVQSGGLVIRESLHPNTVVPAYRIAWAWEQGNMQDGEVIHACTPAQALREVKGILKAYPLLGIHAHGEA